MSSGCRVCLRPLREPSAHGSPYHPKCLRELFGTTRPPIVPIELAKLHTVGLAMVGHTALSGIQKKVSLGLSVDRGSLQLALDHGRYILKPQTGTYPALPENEHVTMRIAGLVGIDIPPCGVIPLQDGSIAYIVRRFDRADDGSKRLQEDFCQLARLPPKEKYSGSYEQCLTLARQWASEPAVAALRLFRQLAFAFWTGNGDMHRKNLALLRDEEGLYSLSPAFDLLSTELVIAGDQLALSIAGKKKNVTRKHLLACAQGAALPERAAVRVLDALAKKTAEAKALIERSLLPGDSKTRYAQLLERRASALTG